MESILVDLRYALRRLRSRPLYATLAVLTLALGVGGASAITAVVRALLLRPLPYAAESQLGVFWNPFDWNESEFLHLRPDFPGFTQVAAWRNRGVTLQTDMGSPTRLVPAVLATAELFEVLGARPQLGRTFQKGDDLQGAEPVAVLSYGLWQEMGGDPAMVGRRLRFDGTERTVVGVMPRAFWFPDPAVRVWLVRALDPQNQSGNYALVGRSASGSLDGLGPHLARITARLRERYTYPRQWDKTRDPEVTPLREYLLGSVRPPVLATLAAMAMILLIACANVSALMLGQVDGRATELAVRAALGADRRRLLQQPVAEALVVGLLAGLLGALVAALGFGVLLRALPLGTLAEGAAVDWSVFALSMATALGASVLVALVPVASLWRGDLRGVLATTRTAGVGARGGRLEGALVVGEVALAVLMAAGAALLVRTVGKLYAIDPGVRAAEVAVLDVVLPGSWEVDRRRGLVRALLEEARALPGVHAAAVAGKLPLRGGGNSNGITVEGKPELARTTTYFRIVTPGYFEVMGQPLRAGRTFTEADRGAAPPEEGGEAPVVINQALADRYLPGEDPLGRFLGGGFGIRERVIGVVGNAAEGNLVDPPEPARYYLVDHTPIVESGESLVMRVQPGVLPVSVLGAARAMVERRAPEVAVRQATTMQAVFDEAVGPARPVMVLLILLTGLAVLLGAVGVYGVISHLVARHQRDWAIRLALGLAPAEVVAAVVRRGAALVAAGVAAGVVCALVLTRLIRTLLYGVTAADPLALVAAGVLLLAVGVVAALVPAWRASRTPPAMLLREV